MTWWLPTANEGRRPARALALALALAAFGCGPPRAQLESDQGLLRGLLGADGKVSGTLHQADRAMAIADADEARRLVLREAKPAADDNVKRAEGAAPATEWGRARGGELRALLRERAASLDEYAAAMGSGDAERVLGALERQQAIERRALALAKALETLP
ncbi:MAG TPA: hypothetical protein VFS00_15235 [Polyangiaceae bacterium]|nr:hypothetical protein [Polyangiaceae bacterium]